MMKFLKKFSRQEQPVRVAQSYIPSKEKVAEMTEQAKARMVVWGRKTLMEGGICNLHHNTILEDHRQSQKQLAVKV